MDLLSAIAEENAAFLTGREFGEVGTYTAMSGQTVKMQCIFDLDSEEITLGEQATMDGTSAVVTVDGTLVPDVVHGEGFAVRGVDYRIVGIEPDVAGMVMLKLTL